MFFNIDYETSSNSLPWTKRKSANKDKKQKKKNRRKVRKISDSFDFIRAAWITKEEFICCHETANFVVSETSLERRSATEELYSFCPITLTSSLETAARDGLCCDGAFGCA